MIHRFLFVILLSLSSLYGSQEIAKISDDDLSRHDKDLIIEQALMIHLSPTDTIVSDEVSYIEKEAWQKVAEAHYEEAIEIVTKGLQTHPTSFALQSFLACLLGDCSAITPEPLKERMVKQSKELFTLLMHQVKEQSAPIYFFFMNEYYFRFALYEDQYKLGIARVEYYWQSDEFASEGYRGYYSQGVGAARYARVCLEQGDRSLAIDYAQKAIVAWAQYFTYRNNYYNSYVHYALALGILGYKDEMMRALARSASLIKKDMDYFEFKEVIDFVNNYSDKV